MITIHYDFTDGTEVSRGEGLQLGDDFTTNCLTFFNNDYDYDCKIVRKDGRYILMSELYVDHDRFYTNREIRQAHNILKIFIANGFNWKEPKIKTTTPITVPLYKALTIGVGKLSPSKVIEGLLFINSYGSTTEYHLIEQDTHPHISNRIDIKTLELSNNKLKLNTEK